MSTPGRPINHGRRAAIRAAISVPGATVAEVARAFQATRLTVRVIRDEAGVTPAPKGKRKKK
jgi:transposase-like protein